MASIPFNFALFYLIKTAFVLCESLQPNRSSQLKENPSTSALVLYIHVNSGIKIGLPSAHQDRSTFVRPNELSFPPKKYLRRASVPLAHLVQHTWLHYEPCAIHSDTKSCMIRIPACVLHWFLKFNVDTKKSTTWNRKFLKYDEKHT